MDSLMNYRKEELARKENNLIVSHFRLDLAPTTHVYNGHALIESKISIMRDINTPSSVFRKLVEEVTN